MSLCLIKIRSSICHATKNKHKFNVLRNLQYPIVTKFLNHQIMKIPMKLCHLSGSYSSTIWERHGGQHDQQEKVLIQTVRRTYNGPRGKVKCHIVSACRPEVLLNEWINEWNICIQILKYKQKGTVYSPWRQPKQTT